MIDVIIPVYNQLKLVKACLDSVLASCDLARHEIVVIDDASTDAELRAYLLQCATARSITLLSNPANLGFTRSVNRGMRLHPDRDVILLNSDTVVHGDWIDRLCAAASAAPRIATVNPLTNASHIGCYPGRAPQGDIAFEIGDDELDRLAQDANAGQWVEVHTTVGFSMLIKRACLREVGLFDAVHFPLGYGEESDFCYRAATLGWRHIVCGDVFVRHWEGQSFGERKARLVEQMLGLFTRLHPSILEKDPSFARRDPIRKLRANLDLARLRRRLAGATTLRGVVLPAPQAEGVDLAFDPVARTAELRAPGIFLPDLPRFRLPGEIAALNATLRRLGIEAVAMPGEAERAVLSRALAGQDFELGLAARLQAEEETADGARRQNSGVRTRLGRGDRSGAALA